VYWKRPPGRLDDLDEDRAERPRFPRAVVDRSSRPGSELTTLEAVGDQWRYALVAMQAGDDDDDDDDDDDTTGQLMCQLCIVQCCAKLKGINNARNKILQLKSAQRDAKPARWL